MFWAGGYSPIPLFPLPAPTCFTVCSYASHCGSGVLPSRPVAPLASGAPGLPPGPAPSPGSGVPSAFPPWPPGLSGPVGSSDCRGGRTAWRSARAWRGAGEHRGQNEESKAVVISSKSHLQHLRPMVASPERAHAKVLQYSTTTSNSVAA